MDNKNLSTDVYMKTEHLKKRPKAKVSFEVVINKVIVGALLLTTIAGVTTPAYAATVDNYADYAKVNLGSTITQNYEISVENAIHNVRETVSAIQEMKANGVVTEAVLKQLATQVLELDRAVNLSGNAVTEEVAVAILEAENAVSGLGTAAGVQASAAIAVAKQSLGIKTVAHTETISNKEAVQTVTSFSDVSSSHWAYKDIMTLTSKGIISGVSTPINGVGKYAPNDTVSLGEFLAIATRLVAEESIKPIANSGHWAAQNYAAAVESGLISSRDFKSTIEALNAGISREDMAYILVSVAKANGETLQVKEGIKNNINDYSSISSNRRSSVEAAYSNGLLVGDNQGNFNPKKSLSRAEVSAVFCRVMNYTTRPSVVVKTPVKELTGTEQAKEVFNQIPTYNQKTNHGFMVGDVGYTFDDVSTFAFNFLTAYLNYDATDKTSIDNWEKEVSKYVTTGSLASVSKVKQELIDTKDKCKVDVYVDATKIEMKDRNFIVHAVVYDYITNKTIKVDLRIGGHNINKSEIAIGQWKLTTVK